MTAPLPWRALAPLVLLAGFAGCSDSRQAPSHTLLEWALATGSCAEDHVGQPFPYEGSFVRWANHETGREAIYGSVVDREHQHAFEVGGAELDAWLESRIEGSMREMMGEPRRYSRPHMVVFDEIPPEVFESEQWTVVGESEHIPPGDAPSYGYATTCTLTVRERRAEMPSIQEQRQIEAHWRAVDSS